MHQTSTPVSILLQMLMTEAKKLAGPQDCAGNKRIPLAQLTSTMAEVVVGKDLIAARRRYEADAGIFTVEVDYEYSLERGFQKWCLERYCGEFKSGVHSKEVLAIKKLKHETGKKVLRMQVFTYALPRPTLCQVGTQLSTKTYVRHPTIREFIAFGSAYPKRESPIATTAVWSRVDHYGSHEDCYLSFLQEINYSGKHLRYRNEKSLNECRDFLMVLK